MRTRPSVPPTAAVRACSRANCQMRLHVGGAQCVQLVSFRVRVRVRVRDYSTFWSLSFLAQIAVGVDHLLCCMAPGVDHLSLCIALAVDHLGLCIALVVADHVSLCTLVLLRTNALFSDAKVTV